jgi:hypothetical protein
LINLDSFRYLIGDARGNSPDLGHSIDLPTTPALSAFTEGSRTAHHVGQSLASMRRTSSWA